MMLLTTFPKIFSNNYNNLMFLGTNVVRCCVNYNNVAPLEIFEETLYVAITSVFYLSVSSSVCLWPLF